MDAFAALYRAHVGRVHALALRLTADRGAAEELTQDVFVRVWERLGSFRGESAFGTWVHRLAVNLFLLERRGAGRREARVATVEDPAAFEDGATGGDDVLSAIDLDDAIRRLPPGMRAAFVLYEIEGYPHDEVAAQLGVAPGTVRAQCFRARQLLREWLDR